MKLITSLILLLTISVVGHAQKYSMDFWHDGEMDVNSGKTLRGKIKYDLEAESIQFMEGNVLRSYSASNVDAFQIVDALDNRVRYFYSLPYTYQNQYQKNHFFELLTEGYFTLLAREKLVERVRNVNDPFSPVGFNTYRVFFLEYDFFLVDPSGEIISITSSKPKEVIEILKGKEEKLETYIKQNRLRLEEWEDMTKLVSYYNSLKG